MAESFTKDSLAQTNLNALFREGIVTPDMRSKALKGITDPRIIEILKHSASTINRKLTSTYAELKKEISSSDAHIFHHFIQ